VFNEEGVIISRELGDTPHRVLDGGTPDYLRQKLIREFQEGSLPIIISKPKLLGFGMNFQADCAMKFSDWTDSFEQQYQLSGGWFDTGRQRTSGSISRLCASWKAHSGKTCKGSKRPLKSKAALQEKYYLEAIGDSLTKNGYGGLPRSIISSDGLLSDVEAFQSMSE
jgi:hypothetical protein